MNTEKVIELIKSGTLEFSAPEFQETRPSSLSAGTEEYVAPELTVYGSAHSMPSHLQAALRYFITLFYFFSSPLEKNYAGKKES